VSFGLLRDHGLRLDPQLTMAIKAMMQVEAVTTLLYPEGGIVADGVPMIKKMAAEAVTTDRIREEATKQVTMAAREVFKRIPSIQDATASWLDQYQKGRFEVTVETSELSKEVDKLGGIGRQLVIGIMLVGMIVGSAIAAGVVAYTGTEDELWDLVFRLAYFGYVFAMIMASLIVIKLVWDWLRGKAAT
jgi:predicted unusual protein kinase regulating ubiquinone biosynthesis (AarF/ABC1/UbiB family)